MVKLEVAPDKAKLLVHCTPSICECKAYFVLLEQPLTNCYSFNLPFYKTKFQSNKYI
jgi:hypothetical protein